MHPNTSLAISYTLLQYLWSSAPLWGTHRDTANTLLCHFTTSLLLRFLCYLVLYTSPPSNHPPKDCIYKAIFLKRVMADLPLLHPLSQYWWTWFWLIFESVVIRTRVDRCAVLWPKTLRDTQDPLSKIRLCCWTAEPLLPLLLLWLLLWLLIYKYSCYCYHDYNEVLLWPCLQSF